MKKYTKSEIKAQTDDLIAEYGRHAVIDALDQMQLEKRLEDRMDEALEIFRNKYFPAGRAK